EIPNAHGIKLIGKMFHCGTGGAEHRHDRLHFLAEIVQCPNIANHLTAERSADFVRVAVKYSDQPESLGFKGKVRGNGLSQISRADENTSIPIGDSENIPDFIAQLLYNIAVSLLPETAETVQILTDLGGSEAHFFRKFLGRNPVNTCFFQVVQKTVVAGETAYHRLGDVIAFWHNFSTRHWKGGQHLEHRLPPELKARLQQGFQVLANGSHNRFGSHSLLVGNGAQSRQVAGHNAVGNGADGGLFQF